jgi:hypothetical protein
MSLLFWRNKKKIEAPKTFDCGIADCTLDDKGHQFVRNMRALDAIEKERGVEPKPDERSGFIREMSHKHLTTRRHR